MAKIKLLSVGGGGVGGKEWTYRLYIPGCPKSVFHCVQSDAECSDSYPHDSEPLVYPINNVLVITPPLTPPMSSEKLPNPTKRNLVQLLTFLLRIQMV